MGAKSLSVFTVIWLILQLSRDWTACHEPSSRDRVGLIPPLEFGVVSVAATPGPWVRRHNYHRTAISQFEYPITVFRVKGE
jgi:hypothetical protein